MRRFLNERHRRSPRPTNFRIAALTFVALIVAFFPVPEGTYSFDGSLATRVVGLACFERPHTAIAMR